MKKKITQIDGHITSPRGFRAAGVQAGIKKDQKDMALIVSEVPSAVAGVFTTNRVQAAPVRLCRERIPNNQARAIIINGGNANACTGAQGFRDAETMARLTAERLQVEMNSVLVCSTGTIGRPLPMDIIAKGIDLAAAGLSEAGGPDAAMAILTTDTHSKQLAMQFTVDGKPVTIGGMAKGAGMICPTMATLLAFLTTDAAIEVSALQTCLSSAVDRSFNRITVDGDQSTNDTVLLLANGMAGNSPLDPRHPDWKVFCSAVNKATQQLALMIVKDGEGATKQVTITVNGAPCRRAAEKVARSVANSLLVKTSWFGADPNWGRVICAVGYSGVPIQADRIDIFYDGTPTVKQGQSAGLSPDVLRGIIMKSEFTIDIDLHLGQSSYTVYTCDCSDQYVHINASYMT